MSADKTPDVPAEFSFLAPRPAMRFAEADAPARALIAVAPEGLEQALADLPPAQRAFVEATGFKASAGQVALLPGSDGAEAALLGLGTSAARARERFSLTRAASALPEGAWRIEGDLSEELKAETALGWLLAGYRFGRYAEAAPPKARLICPEGLDAAQIEAVAEGEAFTRDLINTPASDMGPDELEGAARLLAERHGAEAKVIKGDDLLTQNFPMIHAVGRASPRTPRLIELSWGSEGPALTLVGNASANTLDASGWHGVGEQTRVTALMAAGGASNAEIETFLLALGDAIPGAEDFASQAEYESYLARYVTGSELENSGAHLSFTLQNGETRALVTGPPS
ncbi:hypothetical protein [Thioclava electrotropha]|uniref:hypothetical protein n=1 Tax=Thioclava electrotropha TaxID=1549850 RepID=UPI0023A8A3CE|nr:hypothetical protein [Thioclava electrotropha]